MKKASFLTRIFFALLAGTGLLLFPAAKKVTKQPEIVVPEIVLDGLKWRCIGPSNMGGRIDDFAVVESNPSIIYVAAASGGVWKTTNNGVTWNPIFDDQSTSSISDIAVASTNPDVVWVGTGEQNNRQSSSWGDGVYESTDGGKTWKNMGLRDTHHIGRIVIHPTNPDIVYVAALGHLWDANKERGLFRTTDGGKTWVNTKFIDENTGFVDVAIDYESPNTLYAAAYQRRRTAWGFDGGGPGSGLYKTTDGGETWVKLGGGLPEGITGRIGIDIYRRNPSIVYVLVENRDGGVFRSEDKGLTWKKMSSTNPRPMYYSQIRIDPNNDQRIWVLGASMYFSEDGGKTFSQDLAREIHSDHHAMWINPANSNQMIVGSDGGIHFSYDRGLTWDFINTIPLGQFYEVGFDFRKPYFIYGGLQDNGSWGGPSATWFSQGITNDEWFRIGGGDGFYTQVDPENCNTIYAESQDGNIFRFDLKSGESKSIRPEPDDPKEIYRFNWNSPILISPQDHKTVYYGGNRLFISHDRGDTWEASLDLTTQQDRDKLPVMGAPTNEKTLSRNDGVVYYGTITTIAESPLKAGILWAGTDDGNVQVSRDGGKTWKNVVSRVPGVPPNTYVSRVEASHFNEGTAYVAFDGHRTGDFKAYIFLTNNYGEAWTSISAGIPEGSTVSVVKEHPKNPSLLFVGTERGAYFSIDKGGIWVRMRGNLPMVPVDDIAIHPRENDLIFATHGRSFWILDGINALEQLTKEVLASPSFLFAIRPATIFNPYFHKGNLGNKFFVAPNPPYGAIIDYYLKEKAKDNVKVVIKDNSGNIIQEISAPREAGANRVTWNLRYAQPASGEQAAGGRMFASQAPFVLPGEYIVTLEAAGQELANKIKVEGDPRLEISFEGRKAQHDALLKLFKLQPNMDAVESTTGGLKKQLDDLQGTLKKVANVPVSVLDMVKAVSRAIDEIRAEFGGSPGAGFGGMRFSLRGRLMMLRRAIGGYTGIPSAKQLQQIQQYSEQLIALIEKINKIIDVDWPQLNKLMQENNIPHLLPVQKIKI